MLSEDRVSIMRELLTLLDYDPAEGQFFWKGQGSIKPAGGLDRKGYTRITSKGKGFRVSHLVWLAETGEVIQPSSRLLHKNFDKEDSRFPNLFKEDVGENLTPWDDAKIKDHLVYDPGTGVLSWRFDRWQGRVRAGDPAGFIMSRGYLHIRVGPKKILAHRLAWFLHTGKWPENEIDHINGVRADNRIANLREATRSENMQNQRRASKNNSTGFLGVRRSKDRFTSRITVEGVRKTLGYFDTPEEAHQAYLEAKRKYHPTCTI